MSLNPKGIYPILYAFFNEDGSLNRPNFQRQIEACLAAGAHGIAILGLVTEVGSLTSDERKTLIDWTVEAVCGHVPVAVTIAGASVEAQIEQALYAQDAGASWMVLQPPLGRTPASEELLEFFSKVMQEVSIPVGIQNAPEYIGCGLQTPHMIELARRHPHFTVMKGEGPVITVKPYVEGLKGQVSVFNGRGGVELYDNLKAGCAGLVPAPDCADVQIKLYNAFMAGEFEAAQVCYHALLPYAVYSVQNIATAVYYGKRMFAERLGLEDATRCRAYDLHEDPFFMEAGRTWAKHFGAYGS